MSRYKHCKGSQVPACLKVTVLRFLELCTLFIAVLTNIASLMGKLLNLTLIEKSFSRFPCKFLKILSIVPYWLSKLIAVDISNGIRQRA